MIGNRFGQIGGATVLMGALLTMSACGPTAGSSEDYPQGTVKILVPYDAGGPTDHLARITAAALEEEMGGTFVVENQPGGGGSIAVNNLLSGPADGSQIVVTATPSMLIPPELDQAEYAVDDFTPVGLIAEQPIALVTSAESGYDTPEAFFEAARAEPDTVTIGTNGPTTAAGIAVSRLKDEYDLPIQQVPFGGQAELTSNLLGGSLDAIIANVDADTLGRIESGEFVPLAVFSPESLPYLPDVAPLAELGFDEVTLATSRFGLIGPADMEDEIRQALAEGLEAALSNDSVRAELGENYVSDEFISGAEWHDDMREAAEVYATVLDGQE